MIHTARHRLAFVTTGTARPTNSVIGWYNDFVTIAATHVAALDALGTTWTCIGSTLAVSAKTNTSTHLIGTDDVPIYTTTGLPIASGNADLWDGAIENPISYDDGTAVPLNTSGGNIAAVWTGTRADGTSAFHPSGIPGDGNPLGSGPSPNNIILARGGYTDGRWIGGVTDHDASAKHYLAMSAVIDNSANVAVWELGGRG